MSAQAATTVSGDRDTNSPLIIDPSGDPGTFTHVNASFVHLMHVEGMPITKRIDRVTLGDVGRAASCTGPARYNLQISEGRAGTGTDYWDTVAASWQTGGGGPVSLGTSPGKVTWRVPPVTLKQGKTYRFYLSNVDGCTTLSQTTFPHNGTRVDPGANRCTDGPNFQLAGNTWIKRFWHVKGQDDQIAACVNRPEGNEWSKDMPTGWLVSDTTCTSCRIIQTHGHWSNQPPPAPGHNCVPDNRVPLGATEEKFWRTQVIQPNLTNDQQDCVWNQYADLGAKVPDGWYYALPFQGSLQGKPRDMYLRLDTVDYDAMLRKYSPLLKYDSQESFFADSAATVTDNWWKAGVFPGEPCDASGPTALMN